MDFLIEKVESIEQKIKVAYSYRQNNIRDTSKDKDIVALSTPSNHTTIKEIIERSSQKLYAPPRTSFEEKVGKMQFRVETIITGGILHQQAKADLVNMIPRLDSYANIFSGELLDTVISLKKKVEWTLESLEDRQNSVIPINISNESRMSTQEIQTYDINLRIIKQLELLIKQTPAKTLSSTKKNSHISVGDGTFIERILHNFLLSFIYVLKNNYIQVGNTSWTDIIGAINSHIHSPHFPEKIAFYSRLTGISENIENFTSILRGLIITLENFSLENHGIGHFRASGSRTPLLNLITSLKTIQSTDIS